MTREAIWLKVGARANPLPRTAAVIGHRPLECDPKACMVAAAAAVAVAAAVAAAVLIVMVFVRW